MRKLNPGYLKGGSILEVMIALALITACMAISVVIYLNLQNSTQPFRRLKAIETAEYCLKQAIADKNFHDEMLQSGGFTVKKNLKRHETYNDCLVIRVMVFDRSKKKIEELESWVCKEIPNQK